MTPQSFFALPYFEDEMGDMPHFWMYWAVTLPLTVITLSTWGLWDWYMRPEGWHDERSRKKKKQAKSRKRAKFVEEEEEIKNADEENDAGADGVRRPRFAEPSTSWMKRFTGQA